MSPWDGSAEAATSGTSRHCEVCGAGPQLKLVSGSCAWLICCQDGAAKSTEFPPPPAPPSLFHAVSNGTPEVKPTSEVPPTPVTAGWSAGSSTERALLWSGG